MSSIHKMSKIKGDILQNNALYKMAYGVLLKFYAKYANVSKGVA